MIVEASRLVIDVRHLVRAFNGRVVIPSLDLQIRQGEIVVLLGQSGCGKTTLLRTLAGLDAPDGGSLVVSDKVSVVFQEPRLLPWMRVIDNVALKDDAPEDIARASRILEEVGLAHRGDAWPVTLSGGEAQRAALARALMTEPELLLLDEPFAALDALTRLRMHVLMRALIRRHAPGTLLVTHDVEEAIALGDRILVMSDGSLTLDVDVARTDKEDSASMAALKKRLIGELGVFDATEPATAAGAFEHASSAA